MLGITRFSLNSLNFVQYDNKLIFASDGMRACSITPIEYEKLLNLYNNNADDATLKKEFRTIWLSKH